MSPIDHIAPHVNLKYRNLPPTKRDHGYWLIGSVSELLREIGAVTPRWRCFITGQDLQKKSSQHYLLTKCGRKRNTTVSLAFIRQTRQFVDLKSHFCPIKATQCPELSVFFRVDEVREQGLQDSGLRARESRKGCANSMIRGLMKILCTSVERIDDANVRPTSRRAAPLEFWLHDTRLGTNQAPSSHRSALNRKLMHVLL